MNIKQRIRKITAQEKGRCFCCKQKISIGETILYDTLTHEAAHFLCTPLARATVNYVRQRQR